MIDSARSDHGLIVKAEKRGQTGSIRIQRVQRIIQTEGVGYGNQDLLVAFVGTSGIGPIRRQTNEHRSNGMDADAMGGGRSSFVSIGGHGPCIRHRDL